jgi:DNA-binding MarR family transcriptional regulator
MNNIIRDITEITRCGVQYRTDAFAPMGLKACHGSYLQEICGRPGISQEQLAESICINKSNVARQAATLEEGGFIERRTCGKDKRVLRLYLTEKAQAMLPCAEQIDLAWEAHLLQGLTDSEQQILEILLLRLHQAASEGPKEVAE